MSTEGVLADALARMSPDNKDLTALRQFARDVYADRGMSPMQLFFDLAADIDITVLYLERPELDGVLGRRLSDDDFQAVQDTLLDPEFEEELSAKMADSLLVQAGLSA